MSPNLPDPAPRTLERWHFVMMVMWALLLVPTLVWWKESILWIAAMSLYANFVGHFSGWDAARAEARVEAEQHERNAAVEHQRHEESMTTIASLDELTRLATAADDLYVRVSAGPDDDRGRGSVDFATGLRLPGLSTMPLCPPEWWRGRPLEEWVARQVCAYEHLVGDGKRIWVLAGRERSRGPDNEPLVELRQPIGWLSDDVMAEARDRRPSSPRPDDRNELPEMQQAIAAQPVAPLWRARDRS